MATIGHFIKWFVFIMVPRWLILTLRSDIPRKSSEDPAEHSDYEIGWSLQDGWETVVEEHIAASDETLSDDQTDALRRIKINVAVVERREHDEATAFVRPSVSLSRLPDAALGLLLGVPEEAAHAVDQAIREENPGLISSMHVLVSCQFREGIWRPVIVNLEEMIAESDWQSAMAEIVQRQNAWKRSAATDSETHVAIGEAVQLQTDLKEPPFEVMALGVAEVVDESTVRVPIRITSIVPRWSLSSIGGGYFLAMLQTEPDGDGDPVSWSNLETSPSPSSPDFEEVILVKGGSYEAYLYFRADEYSDQGTTQDKPFVELHYLDGTEQIIASDLTRSVPIPERTRFRDGSMGTLWDDPPVDGVGDRLREGQWGEIPVPPRAVTGETVRATTSSNWPEPVRDRPLYDVTVLGEPEAFDSRTLRVPLRITSRHDDLSLWSLDFQLSSSPDTFGRIHHLLYREGAELPDSLPDVTLESGHTREGYVYFLGPDDEASPPPETFTLFWYGDYLFELPIMLDESGETELGE